MKELAVDLKRKANFLFAKRKYKEAAAIFRKLITVYPDYVDGYVGLAKILSLYEKQEEIIEYLEPVAENLKSWKLFKILGDTYRFLANRGEDKFIDLAIHYYNAYHAERVDPVTFYYLGRLLEKKREYATALEYYWKSWDLDPKSRQAFEGIVSCLEELNRPAEIQTVKEMWKRKQGK